MTKKLKIRFVKFECAIVAQQLEIEGIHHFVENMHTQFSPFYLELRRDGVCIAVKENSVFIKHRIFNDNAERDKYLNNVIKWISEEQFKTNGKLEIGKECEASDDGKEWHVRIFAGELDKQFGEPRHLVAYDDTLDNFERYKYVRPRGSCVNPKTFGDIYTWEMEVADER